MKTLLRISLLVFLSFVLTDCSSTNKFMVQGTEEYSKATSKMLGDWNVSEYIIDGHNMIGKKYDKMTANFDFPTRKVTFDIWVSKKTIEQKLKDWEEKFPGIKVDEYKIVYTAKWDVADDIYIYFNDGETNIDIKGGGENFEGFYGWERSKFEMAKSSDDGSLLGSVVGSVTKAATGTEDLFPDFSYSYVYNVTNNTFTLKSGDDKIVLVR